MVNSYSSRGVAQPGSATGLGPVGRRFESFHPDHYKYWIVSSDGRASALHAECRQFDPVTIHQIGGIAQLGERLICIQEVIGSIPVTSTN